MARLEGIWKNNNGLFASSDSDTESETEVGLQVLQQCGIIQPQQSSVATSGKYGPEETGAAFSVLSAKNKKRNGEERLPTRRPNPNVLNRNALLARENRRKKKLYLQTMENELERMQEVNRCLIKQLKRQVKISKRLEQENKCYQEILTNSSKISNHITSHNQRRQSVDQYSTTSSQDVFRSPSSREPLTSCCSTSSLETEPFTTSSFGGSSHDMDTKDASSENFSYSSWNDLWNTDNLLTEEQQFDFPQIATLGKENHTIADDHTYVVSSELSNYLDMPSLSSQPSTDESLPLKECVAEALPGFCMHLTQGYALTWMLLII